MAYYTGPSSTSVKSNSVKKNNIGKTNTKTNTNPGYGTQSLYQQAKIMQASSGNAGNATLDPTRSAGVTYGGTPSSSSSSSSGHSSSSSGHSSSSSGHSSSSSGHSSSSDETYTPQAAPAVDLSWNPNGLIDAYMEDLNRRAEAAYNRSMGIINDYYDDASKRLRDSYNASVTSLGNTNAMNTSAITADAEEAMRQAYINNMLSRKSLQQAMTAQGLNGGATETTRANMENNYGEARNAIDTTRNKNLAELYNQYQNNLKDLELQLNSGLSNLDTNRLNYSMQINSELQDMLNNDADKLTNFINDKWNDYLKNGGPATGVFQAAEIAHKMHDAFDAYNNGEIGVGLSALPNSYITNFNNTANSLGDYSLTPAQVQNPYDPVSMQQAGIQAAASNYQKALAAQEALGATTPQARNTALSQYGNISSLQEILRQLGYM